jgi:hypothetical protein
MLWSPEQIAGWLKHTYLSKGTTQLVPMQRHRFA